MAFDFIADKLHAQQAQQRLRTRVCISDNNDREITIAGKQYLNFSSNDYLGLNHHPQIEQAMNEGVARFGLCASGSSLVTGYHYAHQALEQTICEWLNKARCLLFTSGFAANAGLLQALGQPSTHLLLDKLSHASMIDGALASEAQVKRFRHNDITHLATLLDKTASTGGDQLIMSEGVFSMDGDRANIRALSHEAKRSGAWFAIDDAHAIGVVGEQGQGSIAMGDVDIVMATFGKALAGSGAFIACSEPLHEYLVNFCRHYIYSTAMSPALAWATKQAIALAQQQQWRREKIIELSCQLKSELDASINVLPSESSIHAIVVGDEQQALLASEQLKKRQIWLTAIRPPTVPNGSSRLRVTVCAHHNNKDISYLAKSINEVLCK